MKRSTMLFCMGLFSFGGLVAQSVTPEVIVPQGDNNELNGMSLEWTLGEVVVHTAPHAKGLITQGSQQPTLQVSEINVRVESTANGSLPIDFQVYPNPVNTVLYVQHNTTLSQSTTLKLFNATGEQLLQLEGQADTEVQELDMELLPKGAYFLLIETQAGQYLKAYQITKH